MGSSEVLFSSRGRSSLSLSLLETERTRRPESLSLSLSLLVPLPWSSADSLCFLLLERGRGLKGGTCTARQEGREEGRGETPHFSTQPADHAYAIQEGEGKKKDF